MPKRMPGPLSWGDQGFTLLEMLVIIAILAGISSIAVGTFSGVQSHANDRLVRAEMQEIAKAIRQFRQDTGYYPKTGPFDLEFAGGNVKESDLPIHAGSGSEAKRRWFYSPANFYQVLESAMLDSDHNLADWDPEAGRGWRGPYLKGFAEGYLDIRDGINDGSAAGRPDTEDGDPETPVYPTSPLSGNNIPDVDGIADPFEHRAARIEGNTLLDWSATAGSSDERDVWGRPYLVFGLDDRPWIVSMGRNGEYESTAAGAGGDDIVLRIE